RRPGRARSRGGGARGGWAGTERTRRRAHAFRVRTTRRGAAVKRGAAPAKINLALVVGPRRANGRHELVTVYQRVALSDHITVEQSPVLVVAGFEQDTLVRRALESVAQANGSTFAAHIRKRIPVAA